MQGVGYPNPERSHFEAMDIWQSADPKRVVTTGWLGRAVGEMKNTSGGVPILQLGSKGLPLALIRGAGRRGGHRQRSAFVSPRAGRRQARAAEGAATAVRGTGGLGCEAG